MGYGLVFLILAIAALALIPTRRLFVAGWRSNALAGYFLLIVVLLQQGKGGDIAAAFGGSSSQTAFGARAGARRCLARPAGPPRGALGARR